MNGPRLGSLASVAVLGASVALAQGSGTAPDGTRQPPDRMERRMDGPDGLRDDRGALDGFRRGMGPGAMAFRRGMGGGLWGAALAERLRLSDAQREELRAIRDRQMRHGIQARADLQIARLDLRQLMTNDRLDASALDAQIDRMARMRAELAKSRVASMLEARSVLTPEQRGKLKDLRMHPGPPSGRGRGGNGPGSDEDGGSF